MRRAEPAAGMMTSSLESPGHCGGSPRSARQKARGRCVQPALDGRDPRKLFRAKIGKRPTFDD
jgi:hypothetical protein